MGSSIVALIIFVITILALRLLGSWMLRIDDVISELRKLNDSLNQIKNRNE